MSQMNKVGELKSKPNGPARLIICEIENKLLVLPPLFRFGFNLTALGLSPISLLSNFRFGQPIFAILGLT